MKKKNISIIPLKKEDKKAAKLMEVIANSQWEEYGKIIEAIVSVRNYIYMAHGIDIDDYHWNRIMEEVVKMRLKITKLHD